MMRNHAGVHHTKRECRTAKLQYKHLNNSE